MSIEKVTEPVYKPCKCDNALSQLFTMFTTLTNELSAVKDGSNYGLIKTQLDNLHNDNALNKEGIMYLQQGFIDLNNQLAGEEDEEENDDGEDTPNEDEDEEPEVVEPVQVAEPVKVEVNKDDEILKLTQELEKYKKEKLEKEIKKEFNEQHTLSITDGKGNIKKDVESIDILVHKKKGLIGAKVNIKKEPKKTVKKIKFVKIPKKDEKEHLTNITGKAKNTVNVVTKFN
jgi:hypothetical protein